MRIILDKVDLHFHSYCYIETLKFYQTPLLMFNAYVQQSAEKFQKLRRFFFSFQQIR